MIGEAIFAQIWNGILIQTVIVHDFYLFLGIGLVMFLDYTYRLLIFIPQNTVSYGMMCLSV